MKHFVGFLAALTWNVIISFVTFAIFYDALSDVQTTATIIMWSVSLISWGISYTVSWWNLLCHVPWGWFFFGLLVSGE